MPPAHAYRETIVTRWAESDNGSGGGRGSTPVRRPLGQLALEAGLITNEQLASAIADIQSSGKRLGEVLVSRGLLDELQLSQLLELQDRPEPVPKMGNAGEDEGSPDAGITKPGGEPAPPPTKKGRSPAAVAAAANGAATVTAEAPPAPPPPAPAPAPVQSSREADEALLEAIRRDMVDLLMEVEQRTSAAAQESARAAQLDERLALLQKALQEREEQLAAAREEAAAAHDEAAKERTAVGEQLSRNAELQEKLAETRAASQANEREVSAARQEIQRLAGLIEQRDAQERAVRATLEQLALQLAPVE